MKSIKETNVRNFNFCWSPQIEALSGVFILFHTFSSTCAFLCNIWEGFIQTVTCVVGIHLLFWLNCKSPETRDPISLVIYLISEPRQESRLRY